MHVLRKIVRDILLEESTAQDSFPPHRTMTGKTVKFGCRRCADDLEKRIEDAKLRRDNCPFRSDSREHYNGILKVLRRELRAARKILENS